MYMQCQISISNNTTLSQHMSPYGQLTSTLNVIEVTVSETDNLPLSEQKSLKPLDQITSHSPLGDIVSHLLD